MVVSRPIPLRIGQRGVGIMGRVPRFSIVIALAQRREAYPAAPVMTAFFPARRPRGVDPFVDCKVSVLNAG